VEAITTLKTLRSNMYKEYKKFYKLIKKHRMSNFFIGFFFDFLQTGLRPWTFYVPDDPDAKGDRKFYKAVDKLFVRLGLVEPISYKNKR